MGHNAGEMSVVNSLFYNNTAGSKNVEGGEVIVAPMLCSRLTLAFEAACSTLQHTK